MCVAFAPLLRSVAGQFRASGGPPCFEFPVCCAARCWNQTVSPGVAALSRDARDVGDGRNAVCKRRVVFEERRATSDHSLLGQLADTLPMIRPRHPEVAGPHGPVTLAWSWRPSGRSLDRHTRVGQC